MIKGKKDLRLQNSRQANKRRLWVISIKINFVFFECRVEFASQAGEKDIPLDWALGAFILNTATATSDNSGKSRKILLEQSNVEKYGIYDSSYNEKYFFKSKQ